MPTVGEPARVVRARPIESGALVSAPRPDHVPVQRLAAVPTTQPEPDPVDTSAEAAESTRSELAALGDRLPTPQDPPHTAPSALPPVPSSPPPAPSSPAPVQRSAEPSGPAAPKVISPRVGLGAPLPDDATVEDAPAPVHPVQRVLDAPTDAPDAPTIGADAEPFSTSPTRSATSAAGHDTEAVSPLPIQRAPAAAGSVSSAQTTAGAATPGPAATTGDDSAARTTPADAAHALPMAPRIEDEAAPAGAPVPECPTVPTVGAAPEHDPGATTPSPASPAGARTEFTGVVQRAVNTHSDPSEADPVPSPAADAARPAVGRGIEHAANRRAAVDSCVTCGPADRPRIRRCRGDVRTCRVGRSGAATGGQRYGADDRGSTGGAPRVLGERIARIRPAGRGRSRTDCGPTRNRAEVRGSPTVDGPTSTIRAVPEGSLSSSVPPTPHLAVQRVANASVATESRIEAPAQIVGDATVPTLGTSRLRTPILAAPQQDSSAQRVEAGIGTVLSHAGRAARATVQRVAATPVRGLPAPNTPVGVGLTAHSRAESTGSRHFSPGVCTQAHAAEPDSSVQRTAAGVVTALPHAGPAARAAVQRFAATPVGGLPAPTPAGVGLTAHSRAESTGSRHFSPGVCTQAHVVLQRDAPAEPEIEPTDTGAPAIPAAPQTITPTATNAAGPAAASTPPPTAPPAQDVDALVRKLYDPIARKLKAELRLDRERAGYGLDLRH